jgi:hypothetical protein
MSANPTTLIQFAGAAHFGMLAAGAVMIPTVGLRRHIASLPPHVGRLFWVYQAYVGCTILALGLLSVGMAGELARGGPLATAFCGFTALFWGGRLAIQCFVFDARPYLVSGRLRVGYHAISATLVFLTVVYAQACLKGLSP